ncbi:MAG: hypothetical protein ABSA93_12315 [Streptosporangiaceae bacterium]|jgi:hypothetical protein
MLIPEKRPVWCRLAAAGLVAAALLAGAAAVSTGGHGASVASGAPAGTVDWAG